MRRCRSRCRHRHHRHAARTPPPAQIPRTLTRPITKQRERHRSTGLTRPSTASSRYPPTRRRTIAGWPQRCSTRDHQGDQTRSLPRPIASRVTTMANARGIRRTSTYYTGLKQWAADSERQHLDGAVPPAGTLGRRTSGLRVCRLLDILVNLCVVRVSPCEPLEVCLVRRDLMIRRTPLASSCPVCPPQSCWSANVAEHPMS